MAYKRTKLFIKPNAPLWAKDMIAKMAQWEDEKETISLVVNKPLKFRASHELLKDGSILKKFYQDYVLVFKP